MLDAAPDAEPFEESGAIIEHEHTCTDRDSNNEEQDQLCAASSPDRKADEDTTNEGLFQSHNPKT